MQTASDRNAKRVASGLPDGRAACSAPCDNHSKHFFIEKLLERELPRAIAA
jgi:hypothetical protein